MLIFFRINHLIGRLNIIYSKRGKYLRIELAQIRKYSPSDDIVNEIIYFVYDKSVETGNLKGVDETD